MTDQPSAYRTPADPRPDPTAAGLLADPVPPASLLAIDALVLELGAIVGTLRTLAADAEYTATVLKARLDAAREAAPPTAGCEACEQAHAAHAA